MLFVGGSFDQKEQTCLSFPIIRKKGFNPTQSYYDSLIFHAEM